MKLISAVTFDFWNTLFVEAAPGIAAQRASRLIETLGNASSNFTAREVEFALSCAWQQHRNKWEFGIRYTSAEAAEYVAGTLQCRSDPDILEKIQSSLEYMYPAEELVPCEPLERILGGLAAAGLRLGIVCDTGFSPGKVLWERLESLKLRRFFSGASFSDEVGVYKPDRRIFEHSLAYLRAEPETIVHVGDLWRNDVCGARAAGFRTVRYRAWNDDGPNSPEADCVATTHTDTLNWILTRV
jgi:putative hydrolase of the HAD superfamily